MVKKHFHSLEALRFFAFLKVYLLHVPIQGHFPIFSYLKSGGGIGVSFFFVLSGFLITYLLVFEKLQKGRINVKKFLIRRSLRIWPLFYLMVIIVFLLPVEFKEYAGLHMIKGGYDFDWKFSFSFLENYKMLIEDNHPKTSPLSVFWSLCIEEHFYILWVISLFFIPVKHIFKFLIFGFFIAWTARTCEPFIINNTRVGTNDLFTNIDYFASGGVLGYLVATSYDKLVNFIRSISLSIKYGIVFIILLIVIFQKDVLPATEGTFFLIIRPTIIALLFTMLIAIVI
jgi:peptidoglycan/LPS O-acetylase OafA/YrhL